MARLHDLPEWLVAVSTIALFVGVAGLGLAASRRLSRPRGLHALVDNGVIGWIFSAILGIYAISIGLIAVASWSNSAAAASVASHEAAEIAALDRDLSAYPEPLRGELDAALLRYVEHIVKDAWPQQRRGEVPHRGTLLLSDFERRLYAFAPTTDAQRIIHAEALHAFNRLVEFRRQRLEAVEYAIPATLWSVVLMGAMLSIAASYVFNIESFGVHATMTGLLAAMIGLLVFFIVVTDLPYRGETGIGPESYELVLQDLITPRADR